MANPDLQALSDEQKHSLQEERYIAEIIKIRSGEKSEERRWLRLLFETAGGTAFITVVLGGLLGTMVNSCVQSSLQAREFAQSQEKSKSDLALTQYKDYLERRQDAMKSTYDLVGQCASACTTLASRMSSDNNPKKYPTQKEKEELIHQNNDTYEKFQKLEDDWRSNRDRFGLWVSYYYEGNADVIRCWNDTKESLTKYLDRTEAEYRQYIEDYRSRDQAKVAEKEKIDYETKVGKFTQCLQRNNRYFWKIYFPD